MNRLNPLQQAPRWLSRRLLAVALSTVMACGGSMPSESSSVAPASATSAGSTAADSGVGATGGSNGSVFGSDGGGTSASTTAGGGVFSSSEPSSTGLFEDISKTLGVEATLGATDGASAGASSAGGGISTPTEPELGVGGCWNDFVCGNQEYCRFASGCGRLQPGTCEVKASGCTKTDDPVCGCNGQTYENRCLAGAAGVSVWMSGACPKTCTKNSECSAGASYCLFEAECGLDVPGVCSAVPAQCPTFEAAVCGCDGKTYQNSCVAAKAGVSVAALSACSSEQACERIDRLYRRAIAEAKQCKGDSGLAQCALQVPDSLICPCSTTVEASNSAAFAQLSALDQQYRKQGCASKGDSCTRVCGAARRGCDVAKGRNTGSCAQ